MDREVQTKEVSEPPVENTGKESPASKAPAKSKRRQRGSSLSINKALQGDLNTQKDSQEEEEEDWDRPVEGKPQNDFDQASLQKVWDAFVAKSKEAGQKVVVATLANKKLEIKDNFQVEVTLDNALQGQKFHEVKRDLLFYCREQLQNYALFFSEKIIKGSQKLEPYSAPEKYQYLLNKNPHLARLRDDLGLDIEWVLL